ncbi:3-dehydroquinate synthase [Solidesulfovibrio carbinoliphilus subsp. oakridgensis]|uniref:3-dehydroquinate synthase n=1 Tax=Solidesulfovibrio carbinoliphilus subsp. oakridgensis TaxID=694327 RepID=G7Q733_9BACT|nr:iron-containing alcohol dehydrogenase family protein [Solidesulfovibrio carbinoliphilus]EHJ48516.1 3-dehydroquinate synthase [Solidesulfovibrio carbinoliphilus subsp. oakridgensis]
MKLISVPGLVRIKPGALDRLGLYLRRPGLLRVLVLASTGLPGPLAAMVRDGLAREGVAVAGWSEVADNRFEDAAAAFGRMPKKIAAIVGIGGGKALDMAKYLAFLARLPYYAVPTSLSNDGFCSPQASLTLGGKRRSLAAALPQGVVIDVAACLTAPRKFWLSGVGDLASKLTAVFDWKLAFHHRGEPVDDLAALLSDATVRQFLGSPGFDAQGMTLLGTALMLNGIAMEICGSSRPASGSEHLISHALDATAKKPKLHGLQVGLAAYVVSRLQGQQTEILARLFEETGFFEAIRQDPFSEADWLEAVRLAPTIKEDFFTVLSMRDCLAEVRGIIRNDPRLAGCFVD